MSKQSRSSRSSRVSSKNSSHPLSVEFSDELLLDSIDGTSLDQSRHVCEVLYSEAIHESPIDINISKMIRVDIAPELTWMNFESIPRKMKITNNGHTVIMSGKWGQERPYISNGVLNGKYVFSQVHLHWGQTDLEGSEHTIDGGHYPGEMHVVLFKSCYLTQESALKEKDGIAILVYFLQLQDPSNADFQPISRALPAIAKAHTSIKIPPMQLDSLFNQFESDYFLYRGSITTSDCVHHILWLITRCPIGISSEQSDSLRFLLDNDDELIRRNFRPVQPIHDRHVFHILPSTSTFSTLLPIQMIKGDNSSGSGYTQVYQLLFEKSKEGQKKKENINEQVELIFKNSKNIEETDEEIVTRTLSLISELSQCINLI
ncbi:unnamed protein product [Ceutorhynchus assimilis]|uniref:Carbonic anhydrase n=1 Tax=Ceutorhynchus assimilis TaxID=467358 RepID=A0A9N9MP99_9CUCU|nr:unnamed protein product [Ceutorhynchus assimilis]